MGKFTLEEFKTFFRECYGYISHSLTDDQVQGFINRVEHSYQSIEYVADLFQDYLLANDLADDVQL